MAKGISNGLKQLEEGRNLKQRISGMTTRRRGIIKHQAA